MPGPDRVLALIASQDVHYRVYIRGLQLHMEGLEYVVGELQHEFGKRNLPEPGILQVRTNQVFSLSVLITSRRQFLDAGLQFSQKIGREKTLQNRHAFFIDFAPDSLDKSSIVILNYRFVFVIDKTFQVPSLTAV